jgi:hypothetical protein
MSKRNISRVKGWPLLAGLLAVTLSTMALADEFVPYPGKREATLSRVEAPNLIWLTFDTDAYGFFRTIRVRLPGIVVAQDTPQADECERKAAQRALAFTENFLADADKIYIQDMRMQNSADEDGISPVLTDKGSLSAALEKEGLARSDKIDAGVSWCK